MFVFFKQKTAYEMRISDWSSDVCSSDLAARSRMRSFRNPKTGWSTHMQVELVDEHGRDMVREGFVVSTMSEAGYGVHQLMRWDIDGRIGWGEDKDVWNAANFVRMPDARKVTARPQHAPSRRWLLFARHVRMVGKSVYVRGISGG